MDIYRIGMGEIAHLLGFCLLPLVKSLAYAIVIMIPFLFFKKMRHWKTFISIWLICAGYEFGGILGGNFYLISIERKIGNPKIIGWGIWLLVFAIFSISSWILLKILKTRKAKWIYLAFLILFLHLNGRFLSWWITADLTPFIVPLRSWIFSMN